MRCPFPGVALVVSVVACEPQPLDPRSRSTPEIKALEDRFAESKSATVALQLSAVLADSGRGFEAADVLLEAELAGQATPKIHAALAQTYADLGYGRAVIRELGGCLERARRQPDCLYLLGRILEEDGTPSSLREARRTYTLFLEVAPDHPEANRARSALEQLGGPLREAASRPSSAPAAPGLAAAHPGGEPAARAGGPARGNLNPFGQALAEAFAALRDGQPASAEAAYRRALDLRPDHAGTRAGLAQALSAQGKEAEAVREIEAVFADSPTDPQVRFVFGALMLRSDERRAEAIAAWEALVRDTPDIAEDLGLPERLAALRQIDGETTVRPPIRER